MTAHAFRKSLDALSLTQAQFAEVAGLGLRTVNGYANGRPIPKTVELALLGLAAITCMTGEAK